MLPDQSSWDVDLFRASLGKMSYATCSTLYTDVIERGDKCLAHIMRDAFSEYFDRSRPLRIIVENNSIYLFPQGINGEQCKVQHKFVDENNNIKYTHMEFCDHQKRWSDVDTEVDESKSIYFGTRSGPEITLTFGHFGKIVGVWANNVSLSSAGSVDFRVEYL